jgi:hypothetical protein
MTVQQLVNLALRKINVIASGESPSSDESADALVVLNQLVDSWTAQQVPLYSITAQTKTLTGAASYALATRIARIKSAATLTAAGLNFPIDVVDAGRWAAIPDKTRTGLYIESLYYDHVLATGTVYVTPKPSAGTLEVWSYTPLAAFGALGDTVTLPVGYERALSAALAADLAPEYGRSISPELQATAAEAIGAIAKLNAANLGPDAAAAPVPQAPQQAA